MDEYVRALCREIELCAQAASVRLPVHTVFFGGGTPSLLSVENLSAIVRTLKNKFALQSGAEITLECNPDSLTHDYLRAVRALGLNRLSLGAQSAHPADLALLEREHAFPDVIRALSAARRAGFENVNLDLIFGIPIQSLARWRSTIKLALDLQPEHLSLYALTLEHGTPLESWVARGLVSEPDPDLSAVMYDFACEALGAASYQQYEISNWVWSRPDQPAKVCRHNLQYWRNQPYLGFGAGAHGFSAGVRTSNVRRPSVYARRCLDGSARDFPRTPATVNVQAIDRRTEMEETMLMGLRLTQEGISKGSFNQRFGEQVENVFSDEIEFLVTQRLLEWAEQGEVLRLTPRGRLLGDQVFRQFVA